MRITKLWIKEYKNLKDFTWELNPESPVAVIVGKNASGKTNLLEVIVLIFQRVLLASNPQNSKIATIDFEFEINYKYHFDEKLVAISYKNKRLIIKQNSETIDIDDIITPFNEKTVKKSIQNVLPDNLFLYYAGFSKRFEDILKNFNSQYYFGVKDNNIKSNRPILNYESIHYKIVLLALLLSQKEYVTDFLRENFGISKIGKLVIGFDKPNRSSKGNKSNYWDAKEHVKIWIEQLRTISSEAGIKKYHRGEGWEFTFNPENIRQNALNQIGYDIDLFYVLDKLYVLGYLKSIELYVQKEGIIKEIEFDALSEGEKQRLAIFGAMKIFDGKETLFLLDEPDAFAHPRWQWDFIPDIQKAIGDNTFQQVLFITHSPIILSSLTEPAFVMENGKIRQMNSTLGNTVNETLAEQNVAYQEEDIAKDLKVYIALIQDGEARSTEAANLRKKLENLLGHNHPELQDADDLIALYE